MLDNVDLIMYMKFQKLLITGCRTKTSKMAQNGVFPGLKTPITPITLNVKVGDAYEKMLKILPTSYLEPYNITPAENPISDDIIMMIEISLS